VHAYNPSTQRLREEDHKFKASLDYIVRPCHLYIRICIHTYLHACIYVCVYICMYIYIHKLFKRYLYNKPLKANSIILFL
jgi:hypothetical protein